MRFIGVFGLILGVLRFSGLGALVKNGDPWLMLQLFVMALVMTVTVLKRNTPAPRCGACGRRYHPGFSASTPTLCPACRLAGASPRQRRHAARDGLLIIATLLFLLSLTLTWGFSYYLETRFGKGTLPLATFGLFAALVVLVPGTMVVTHLVKARLFFNPNHLLAVARTSFGEVGKTTTFGPVSVHVFGQDDPVPQIRACLERCRTRLKAIVAEPRSAERPLRILALGRREVFQAIARRALLYPGNLDGVFVPWPTRTILLTTEVPPYRLKEMDRVLGTLLGYFVLESVQKAPLPCWIQSGMAHAVGCGGDASASARLNRRVHAAVARGTSLDVSELFEANPVTLVGLIARWDEHACFAKSTAFASQAWSLVEFLTDDNAPDRRARFRAFLKGLGTDGRQEASFVQHFGFGFASLLERWQQWVLARGVGAHEPAPPDLREALCDRLAPIVRDCRAKTLERIQAVRDMGRAGSLEGADALIERLGSGDAIPKEEVVWALEAISGLPLGDDASGWWNWWSSQAPAR
jgi:hypothetical protein